MRLKNITQVNEFIKAIDNCEGNVYVTSPYGDKINLKSKLSQYVAVSELIGEHADELELWCDKKDDEGILFKFLSTYDK